MASTPTHFYRLEISAGHTGSAYRYSSDVAGTLGEIKKAIVDETDNAQGLSFLICEDCTFELELHEDGKRVGTWNLYPALKLGLPRGKTLSFLPTGAIEGVNEKDPGMLFEDPVVGPILQGEVKPRPLVDFTVLDLPTPRGKPLPRGSEASFERDGRTETQPYGSVGDWNDSEHRPRKKAAPAKKVATKTTPRATKKAAPAKKPAAKKAVAKKAVAKKPAAKKATTPARSTAKKSVAKKATTKPVAKKTTAKPVAKKAVAKPVAKKPATKPSAKTAVAKTAAKKPAAKKTAARKPAARKPAAKRAKKSG